MDLITSPIPPDMMNPNYHAVSPFRRSPEPHWSHSHAIFDNPDAPVEYSPTLSEATLPDNQPFPAAAGRLWNRQHNSYTRSALRFESAKQEEQNFDLEASDKDSLTASRESTPERIKGSPTPDPLPHARKTVSAITGNGRGKAPSLSGGRKSGGGQAKGSEVDEVDDYDDDYGKGDDEDQLPSDDEGEKKKKKTVAPKKAAMACHFCRHRKLRCNGNRPTCDNCGSRALTCQYDDKIRRRGPGKKKVGQVAQKPSKTNKTRMGRAKVAANAGPSRSGPPVRASAASGAGPSIRVSPYDEEFSPAHQTAPRSYAAAPPSTISSRVKHSSASARSESVQSRSTDSLQSDVTTTNRPKRKRSAADLEPYGVPGSSSIAARSVGSNRGKGHGMAYVSTALSTSRPFKKMRASSEDSLSFDSDSTDQLKDDNDYDTQPRSVAGTTAATELSSHADYEEDATSTEPEDYA